MATAVEEGIFCENQGATCGVIPADSFKLHTKGGGNEEVIVDERSCKRVTSCIRDTPMKNFSRTSGYPHLTVGQLLCK